MADAASLDGETAARVADELLRLADSKLLLGYRYSQWMFSGPSLEACNAASSISQDEFGHARSLYEAYLDVGDADEEQLMHGREPGEYRNVAALDDPPREWPALVVASLLVDRALDRVLAALEYEGVARLYEKIAQEESFHRRYGRAWLKRFADDEADREAAQAAVEAAFPAVYAWFGPAAPRPDDALVDAELRPPAPEMREEWLAEVESTLGEFGFSLPAPPSPDWEAWDPERWRLGAGGPDEPSVRQLRGDESAAFR